MLLELIRPGISGGNVQWAQGMEELLGADEALDGGRVGPKLSSAGR